MALSSACSNVTLPEDTKTILEAELNRCDQGSLYGPDLGVYTEVMSKSPNWRGRLSSVD